MNRPRSVVILAPFFYGLVLGGLWLIYRLAFDPVPVAPHFTQGPSCALVEERVDGSFVFICDLEAYRRYGR